MKDGTINPTNIPHQGRGPYDHNPSHGGLRRRDHSCGAVLKPTEPLEPNTEYTVTVEGRGDGDMKAVKDASGSPLASEFTFSFTTGTSCATCPPPV